MIATLQPIFDRIDPAMWAPYVLSMPLPGHTSDAKKYIDAGGDRRYLCAQLSVTNMPAYWGSV